MDNGYKNWKEELDSADVNELLPGFDREAGWKELSPRLKKTNNRTYVFRYAAAVVAIAAVALLVRMQLNKPQVPEPVAKTVVPVIPATVDTTNAKLYTQPEPTIVPTPAVAINKTRTHKANKPATVHNVAPQPVEELVAKTQPVEEPIIKDTMPQPVVTQAKPIVKRPKAIHILDIDNENRQAVIQNRRELQGLPQRIVNLIPGRQYSNTENDRRPSSLFKTN